MYILQIHRQVRHIHHQVWTHHHQVAIQYLRLGRVHRVIVLHQHQPRGVVALAPGYHSFLMFLVCPVYLQEVLDRYQQEEMTLILMIYHDDLKN